MQEFNVSISGGYLVNKRTGRGFSLYMNEVLIGITVPVYGVVINSNSNIYNGYYVSNFFFKRFYTSNGKRVVVLGVSNFPKLDFKYNIN